MSRSTEVLEPTVEEVREAARSTYSQAFNSAVAKRTGMRDVRPLLARMEKAGYTPILAAEIDPKDEQIDLPLFLEVAVKNAFRGFPNDEKTDQPAIRVKGVYLCQKKAKIDVEPTIPTPPREGREEQFITYPDHSRVIFSSLRFFIASDSYVIGLGNPNGGSTWITSRSGLEPCNGERRPLRATIILDLASLVSTVQSREHSDLRIHKIHS